MSELAIDPWKVYSMIGFESHSAAQTNIINSTAKYIIPCCGRRWGKSTIAARYLLPRLFIPDTRWWIVGPDYSLAEKEFRIIYQDIMHKLKVPGMKKATYNKDQGNMVLHMPWDAILECKSAHQPEKLVGEGLDGMIVSEAAKHSRETWERYLQPALMDKNGTAIFPSTPEGFNWYNGLFELGKHPEFPEYESYHLPSWTNPILFPGGREDPKIKEVERVASPAWFAQEYGAEFTTFEGQIYDEFDEDIHVCDIEYNPGWKNYWAMDFGFSAPFVVLDIMVDPMDNVYIWREYQVRYLTTGQHGEALRNRESPQGYHVDAICADPNGPEEIATLQLMGFGPFLHNKVAWLKGIEAVKRWMKVREDGKPKFFMAYSCYETRRQTKGLKRPIEHEGKNPREGQHDYDDHGPDAYRYFFNEWEVLGIGGSLASVYGAGEYRGSEADNFFTQTTRITLDSHVGY